MVPIYVDITKHSGGAVVLGGGGGTVLASEPAEPGYFERVVTRDIMAASENLIRESLPELAHFEDLAGSSDPA